MDDPNRRLTLQEMNEAQAETIKALWNERVRDKKRIADQQAIIDKQDQEISDLKCPVKQAEKVFRK